MHAAGKTVMLVLQGLRWLRQGHDVHVLSTWAASFSSSCVIQNQLIATMETADVTDEPPGRVLVHRYDFFNDETQVERAVHELTDDVTEGGVLCVIMDEAAFHDGCVADLCGRTVLFFSSHVFFLSFFLSFFSFFFFLYFFE
jgi:hypothetical protein